MRILGAIIAGGQSTRMGGQEKSFLQLDGTSLLERTLSRLRFQVDEVVINANGDASRFAATHAVVVEDILTDVGTPLAGLQASLYYGAAKGLSDMKTIYRSLNNVSKVKEIELIIAEVKNKETNKQLKAIYDMF